MQSIDGDATAVRSRRSVANAPPDPARLTLAGNFASKPNAANTRSIDAILRSPCSPAEAISGLRYVADECLGGVVQHARQCVIRGTMYDTRTLCCATLGRELDYVPGKGDGCSTGRARLLLDADVALFGAHEVGSAKRPAAVRCRVTSLRPAAACSAALFSSASRASCGNRARCERLAKCRLQISAGAVATLSIAVTLRRCRAGNYRQPAECYQKRCWCSSFAATDSL